MKKVEVLSEKLTASTWRELETNGKLGKNEKLSFVSDDMLVHLAMKTKGEILQCLK